ncbi:MAG TPA: methyl-accepting chemotaxis protein [Verrucomicrobiae bacterium]|nr:methyl-accepting chemotaxis protein [Verrucomicrobiae bacterium]
MSNRLSVKIAVILIMVMVVIMAAFTIYFVSSGTRSMEEDLLAKGRLAVLTEAKMMERVLVQALRDGKLSEADLFDEKYVPIPGTDPPKYHTRYDSYLDVAIQDIEDEYLKDEQVAYAVLADRNGYVPTHHRKNSLPLTGDVEKDRIGNRTKRLFNNPVELAAARNVEPFLKQEYRRDTGERMWDLSAPVFVNGKHWGGVRMGISMAVTERKLAALRLKIIGAMLAMLLVSSLTIYLVVRRAVAPLLRLTQAAGRIAEGDLDEEVRVESRDEIGRLAEALNRMTTVIVKNLRGEIQKSGRMFNSIREAILHLSASAAQMTAISTQQASGATEQAAAVHEASITSEEIAVTAKQITENAQRVEEIARQTTQHCSAGTSDVANATEAMARLREQVQGIARSMLQLGDNSQKIGGIVEIIDEISDQTNLLALNAAIEAAGAGESGKRFAIVAREVRRLAERTVEATKQIKALIEEIQKATNSTIMVTEEGTKKVDAAAATVEQVQHSFAGILQMVEETAVAAKEISLSTQQQTTASEQMAETMAEVRDVAQQSAEGARETGRAIAEIGSLTERLRDLIEEEIQSKGKAVARSGAAAMEKVLAEAVGSGRFSIEEIFDDNYIPIPGTNPQKYHTKYDAHLDRTIQGTLDRFLEDDDQVVYAVLADRNGYVPTHNSRYSLPLTGDAEKDKVGNRTKRLFNTPIELAAARNTGDVLVQVYVRDTGEKMWDISFPVFLNGRPWGAFRVGYTM